MKQKSALVRVQVVDESSGMKGFVVVDSLVKGQALGGTRIAPGVTLHEITRLARGMTLKLSLAEMPVGGCKGGVVCNLPPSEKRNDLLKSFGRAVGPLLHGGAYLGTDLGCSYEDRQTFHDAAGYIVPASKLLPCTWKEIWSDLGEITGHGAFEACMAYLDTHPLKNQTVCIQGFGKAGQAMAKRYQKVGYKIVAIADIHGTLISPQGFDIDEMIKITDATGAMDRKKIKGSIKEIKTPDAWAEVDCGVLALAARGDAVTMENCKKIKARVLVEAANHPVTLEAEQILAKSGSVILPDIVANCGSAVATALIFLSMVPFKKGRQAIVESCYDKITKIIQNNIVEIEKVAKKSRVDLPTAALILAAERAEEIHGIPAATLSAA